MLKKSMRVISELIPEALAKIESEQFRPSFLQPFESPIEEELERVLTKYLHEDALLENQVPIQTPNGNFRLDFSVTLGQHKWAFEANGRDFHTHLGDMFRGALIMEFSELSGIFYIRGADIWQNLDAVLASIARIDARPFSGRGILNLANLTGVRRRRWEEHRFSESVVGHDTEIDWLPCGYLNSYDFDYLTDRESSKNWYQPYLELALEFPGTKVEGLVEHWLLRSKLKTKRRGITEKIEV